MVYLSSKVVSHFLVHKPTTNLSLRCYLVTAIRTDIPFKTFSNIKWFPDFRQNFGCNGAHWFPGTKFVHVSNHSNNYHMSTIAYMLKKIQILLRKNFNLETIFSISNPLLIQFGNVLKIKKNSISRKLVSNLLDMKDVVCFKI